MTTRDRLEAFSGERIAVLDGSWGVLIQRDVRGEEAYRGERFRDHPHDVAGDPDLLNLTRPEIVRDIHRRYFEAGADIATTNTFTATSIGQADYGLQDYAAEMSLEGARIARSVADEYGGFVAGSVGPLNVTLSLSPKVDDPAYRAVTFDDVREAYAEQMAALAEGGVDLLLIETIFDTLNAKAAIVAAQEAAPQLPLWLSFTAVDMSGRNLSGQTVEAFWTSVEHAEPFIVGVNCSLGAKEMRPFVEDLARVAPTYVACHPNAGLPNEFGSHDELPADTSRYLRRVRARRAREPRRRLLRHDARTRQGHRGPDPGTVPETGPGETPGAAVQRAGAVRDRPRHRLRDDRRADERHRLGALPAADRGGRLRRAPSRSRSSRCAAAPTCST